jgi:hypothetical protein
MNYEIDDRLVRIVEYLTQAVNVCCEVDESSDNYEKTYPFATGWSRSAMNTAIDDLNRIVKELRK